MYDSVCVFYLRSPSGQQSSNLPGFDRRSGLFHIQRLSADGGLSQQDRCSASAGYSASLLCSSKKNKTF